MKRYIFLIIITITFLSSYSETYVVKQDGTGDFTSIQEAIDHSSNSDTVLVWPGTYYENLVLSEKNIVLGSLTLTTGNTSYKYETIIDGSENGGCIKIDDCPGNVHIEGFTIKNGTGTYFGGIDGGGVFINNTATTIQNSIVSENFANAYGGGIYSHNSNLFLSGVTIRNNHAYNYGGGIMLSNSYCVFDTVNLCNIYNNTAAWGTDIYNGSNPAHYNHVVVDTFTVINPDYYYIFSNGLDSLSPGNTITWEVQNGKNEQVFENVYVSPDGHNTNSGLTSEDPLKNIWVALLRMGSDSVTPDTIILSGGIYSPSNGEKYPLSLKRDVSIRGASRDGTVLDAENKSWLLNGIYYADNYTHSNFTLRNGNYAQSHPYGYGAIDLIENNNATFENILFTQNTGEFSAGGMIGNSNNFLLKNVEFFDNIGLVLRIAHGDGYIDDWDTVYMESCKFEESKPNYNTGGAGGCMALYGQLTLPKSLTCVFINNLFVNNHTYSTTFGPGPGCIGSTDQVKSYVINCSFADNTSNNSYNAMLGVLHGSEMNVFNSIIFNNQYHSAYMFTENWTGDSDLYIQNSLIDGGEEGIQLYTGYNNLYYYPTNIDTDPDFYNGPDFPYNLSDQSPCIDAGTINLPDWIELPEFDLAGNPRIYGDSIDMGAYEWNPTVKIEENASTSGGDDLIAYPNPFISKTSITAKISTPGNFRIEVYNNNGYRISNLCDVYFSSGQLEIQWIGVDSNSNYVPPGTYYIILYKNNNKIDELKIIKQ